MTASPDSLKKWALIVGVDRYEHLDPRYHLEGCANDARAMAAVLKDQFQFPEENITLLVDQQATQAAILDAMRDLARNKVGKDDIVVFHYSGHGSQRTDGPEKDEDDGLDETILAYDARREGPESAGPDAPNVDISDDDIHAWLQDIAKQTRHVTLIFDCCHSGTVAREGPGAIGPLVRVRWVPPDRRPYERLRPALYSVAPAIRGMPEGIRRAGPSGWLPDDERYTLLAGCRSKERSFEVRLREGEVRAHGAFTFHLLHAFANAAPDASYRDIFERVAARVTADFPDQHPQLEGARERQLFGPLHLEPMRFVAVREREGEVVTLEAGVALGMWRGGIWDVYPPGTRHPELATPLGRVEVQSPHAVTSKAVVVKERESGSIGPGCRAVAVTPDFGQQLSVAVEGFSAAARWVEQVEQEIRKSPLLRLATGAVPQVRVELSPPDGPVNPVYPVQGAVWRARSVDTGDLIMPEIKADGPKPLSRLVGNLERKARYDNVLRLAHTDSPLDGAVEMILFRQWGDGWVEIPEGMEAVLDEGERILLEVRSRHDQPVHVQILNLGMGQAIEQVHPRLGGCEELPKGGWFRIGDRVGDEITARIPEGFPYHRNGKPNIRGVEVIKLFVTDQPVDLAPLLQRGIREWTGDGGSLAALFGTVAGSLQLPREILRNLPQGDWAVIERALAIERRPEGTAPARPACNPGRPANVNKGIMNQVSPDLASQAHLEIKVERLERRLGNLIAAFEALLRQLEMSQGMEPSSGVLLSLAKTKLDA